MWQNELEAMIAAGGAPCRACARCHECGARPGHYHHVGCDAERCPVCGGQLISCDCDISEYVERPPRKRTTK